MTVVNSELAIDLYRAGGGKREDPHSSTNIYTLRQDHVLCAAYFFQIKDTCRGGENLLLENMPWSIYAVRQMAKRSLP